MTKNKIVEVIFISLLIVLIAGMSVYTAILNGKVGEYKSQLNNNYENSFYSLSDEVNNIDSTLAKLNVSNDSKMQEKYLAQIASLCEMAQNDLSTLPIEHNSLSSTYKFVNQLGGYAFSLNENLSDGNALLENDKTKLKEMHKSLAEIKTELNNLSAIFGSGYSIVDNISSSKNAANGFSDNFHNMYDDVVKYPSLIYDGPFSDSLDKKEVKGLLDLQYSMPEAENKVKKLFEGYDVSYAGENEGKDFSTYNFNLKRDNTHGFVQITKKGGFVLSYNRENNALSPQKSILECEQIAKEFVEKMGFDNTQIVWRQDVGSCIYINFCYVQDGVIIYPDMIKVKICRESGDVIGFEACSWAYNHTKRNIENPAYSKEQAREKINKNMEEISSCLCVIPNEYDGESLAWEFCCYCDDSIYYVYVDVNTLQELKLLKVVNTNDGQLLM